MKSSQVVWIGIFIFASHIFNAGEFAMMIALVKANNVREVRK